MPDLLECPFPDPYDLGDMRIELPPIIVNDLSDDVEVVPDVVAKISVADMEVPGRRIVGGPDEKGCGPPRERPVTLDRLRRHAEGSPEKETGISAEGALVRAIEPSV